MTDSIDVPTTLKYVEFAVGIGLFAYVLRRQIFRKAKGPLTPAEVLGFLPFIILFGVFNAIERDWIGVGMCAVLAAICYARWRNLRAANQDGQLGLFEPPSAD
jgi:hypothetical protein